MIVKTSFTLNPCITWGEASLHVTGQLRSEVKFKFPLCQTALTMSLPTKAEKIKIALRLSQGQKVIGKVIWGHCPKSSQGRWDGHLGRWDIYMGQIKGWELTIIMGFHMDNGFM